LGEFENLSFKKGSQENPQRQLTQKKAVAKIRNSLKNIDFT